MKKTESASEKKRKKKISVRNRKYKKFIILALKNTITEILKFNGQIQQQNGEDSLISELEYSRIT